MEKMSDLCKLLDCSDEEIELCDIQHEDECMLYYNSIKLYRKMVEKNNKLNKIY